MGLVPLLPPVPLPNAFQIPAPTLDIPLVNPPRWVPIPNRLNEPGGPAVSEPEPEQETVEEAPVRQAPPPPTPSPPPPVFSPAPVLPPLPVLPEVKPEEKTEADNSITIPIIEVELPLPSNEIMITTSVTATAAAVASVGGAIVAKTIFDYLLRLIQPLLKTIINKLNKTRGKPVTTWGRQRLKRQRK